MPSDSLSRLYSISGEDQLVNKADYEDVAEEIYRLREQKQKAQIENANRDEVRKRMADMHAFLREQPTEVAEYNEKLVRRLIELWSSRVD